MIHPTAIISPLAKIGKNVKIGPYSVIGDEVELCDDVEIFSHVCINGRTAIGNGTKVFPFAAIGFSPQDLKYNGEKSCVVVGKNNVIREYVTIHPGTEGGNMKTVIGDGNLLMIGVHVAHDCVIGDGAILANNATLAGHVAVGNHVIIGGLSAVHQFVRIGHHAIIGGMAGVERDVIPYGAVKGERGYLYDVNVVGLLRSGVDRSEIKALQAAYDMIFHGGKTLMENLKQAEEALKDSPYAKEIFNFMNEKSKRSFCQTKGNE
ncbi:MAG: acyl-ACP--UDP-N-acetylglucosamine O-acyltransferase [Alphaproteobacteria bacterium]|nr:acyl-ACP--UDP-N-acetylglucosamine O-acyltransferase [Alphaproteobacteria bacterium]